MSMWWRPKREDWTRDPFIMIEENGYFYGRGTNDMKAQAAIWVDNMVRFREEGFRPKRSIKLALTCGEETNSALNGAGWLAGKRTRRDRCRIRLDRRRRRRSVTPRAIRSRSKFWLPKRHPRILCWKRRIVAVTAQCQCRIMLSIISCALSTESAAMVSGSTERREPRLLHRHVEDRGR